MSTPRRLGVAELRAAAPGALETFEFRPAGGEPLLGTGILRHLPGRRLVFRARQGGDQILVKLFFRHRDYRRERAGLELLRACRIPSPALRWDCRDAGAWLLATEFLPAARALDPGLHRPVAAADAGAVLALLGALHRAGLIQEDPHLDNFLLAGGRALAIDGAGIRRASPGAIAANLALFLAQFPPARDAQLEALLPAYGPVPDLRDLRRQRARARYRRLRNYRRKCVRNCGEFAVERTWRRFTARRRDRADRVFLDLLAAPAAAVAGAPRLKDGNSATVVRCRDAASDLVVKRYNVKDWRHGLRRAPRRSRAWIAWQNAHTLAHLGVPTPQALGLREERWGPLRLVTYLITETSEGVPLQDWIATREAAAVPPWLDLALVEILAALGGAGLSHGDLKASNFLVEEAGRRLLLIDLDGMRLHRSRHGRARRRDLDRFLANWDGGLRAHFARLLAPLAAGDRNP
ncbi:MAG: lipopolysaccharide kinase InaA family protein [Pseudomonadota bacterium]|jgi:tRNA A-37 threonylcarbamoyl transferase component Bud32